MPDWLMERVHRWFRVPAAPEPPAGDPSSLRVFRAGRPYFRYKLIGWGIGQLGVLVGLAAGLVLGLTLVPRWNETGFVGALITIFGVLAWLAFLVQIPLSYAALRLDYELRWYMLSDRAIRIREGILRVREKTMTFANIQQISVRQGPIQRLLGIADIEVRTAGGGSSEDGGSDEMHRGYFRGVADPEAIRDVIRERVQEYRDSGLGDAEPRTGGAGRPGPAPRGAGASAASHDPGAVRAAREVLEEMLALRQALAR